MKRARLPEAAASNPTPRGGARPRCAPPPQGVLGKHRRQAQAESEAEAHHAKRRRLAALEEELLLREKSLLMREKAVCTREAALAERERWVLQLQRQAECNGPAPPWLHAIH